MQAGFLLGWDMERVSWIMGGRRRKELKEKEGEKGKVRKERGRRVNRDRREKGAEEVRGGGRICKRQKREEGRRGKGQ
jgi:hypothetical protein